MPPAPQSNHLKNAEAVASDKITVVMANYRGARWIKDAIQSVLAQSHRNLELIVSDDASGDGSAGIVRKLMASDSRLRLIEAATNAGPAAARNAALEAATGSWVTVVDSDDVIHPQRLERLLFAAEAFKADMVADDMVLFGEAPGVGGRTLLAPLALQGGKSVDLNEFIVSNDRDDLPSMGYLKPLIRHDLIADLRYDPRVTVGEDYDFYLRLLLTGARFVILPEPLYLYRRHDASLSHRLSVSALEALLAAHERATVQVEPDLGPTMARRRATLQAALRFERLVAALKQRQVGAAARLVGRHPGLLSPLLRSVSERLDRRRKTHSTAEYPVRKAVLARDLGQPGTAPDSLQIVLPPLAAPGTAEAPAWVAIATRLSSICEAGPLDVEAFGAEGCYALGLVPIRGKTVLRLDPSLMASEKLAPPVGTIIAPID